MSPSNTDTPTRSSPGIGDKKRFHATTKMLLVLCFADSKNFNRQFAGTRNKNLHQNRRFGGILETIILNCKYLPCVRAIFLLLWDVHSLNSLLCRFYCTYSHIFWFGECGFLFTRNKTLHKNRRFGGILKTIILNCKYLPCVQAIISSSVKRSLIKIIAADFIVPTRTSFDLANADYFFEFRSWATADFRFILIQFP